MKVEKKNTVEYFKPFDIVITVSTEEEKDMLYNLAGFNVSIPKLFCTDSKETCEVFLDKLYKALNGE